tara:strand:+ start:204 stop:524 length:321 start_codon:yes stop_codon:yes gene_type:complete
MGTVPDHILPEAIEFSKALEKSDILFSHYSAGWMIHIINEESDCIILLYYRYTTKHGMIFGITRDHSIDVWHKTIEDTLEFMPLALQQVAILNMDLMLPGNSNAIQ